jgi:hypothetical protein
MARSAAIPWTLSELAFKEIITAKSGSHGWKP